MKNRPSFMKFIERWGIVFLLAVGGSFIAFDLTVSYRDFNLRTEQIRNNYIVRQKNMIKQEVLQVVDLINHGQANSESITKSKIKSRVYEAYAIAEHIYQKYKNIESKVEIRQRILDALRPINFAQGSGYYFATCMDGMEILFADKPELEGLNLLGMRNQQGQYVIKDMIKIVRQSGEGFYEYHWTKPDSSGDGHKKIAFIKYFEPFDCFIGTGLYVDDVEAQIKVHLLSAISRIRFGKEGYIFVNRLNGDALVSNGNCFSGTKKLWEVFDKNPEKMKIIFGKEHEAAAKPQGGFIYYSWIKLSDPNQESPKASFVYGLPHLQWLVGAGVYLDDVETDIVVMHSELNHQIKIRVFTVALLVVVLGALFLLFFRQLSHKLENDFNLFSSFFNRAAHSDETINRDNIQFIELDHLARDANLMLQEKTLAQQKLLNERESLQESEKKFWEMANLLPQIVYETDIQGMFTFVNKQTYDISGYTEEDFSKGINVLDLLIPLDRERALQNIKNLLSGSRIGNFEYTALCKDGSTFAILSSSSQITRDGAVIGLRGIAVNISERKRQEDEVLRTRKLESVGILAGGIAHDFNNLLTAILGNISLALSHTDKQDETYKLLVKSEKASLRAKDLTQQLLTFAKGGEPVKKIAAIDEVIKDSASFVLRGSNIRCEFNFSKELWPVAIDSGQISQVIQNIVINGSQAMPTGGLIEIIGSNYHQESSSAINMVTGKYVKITLKDQGVGIPVNMLDKIFDPYFTTKQQGSGLGLAITHSIVSKHNGYITVNSKLGQGTSFTIYLPATIGTPEAIPEKNTAPVVTAQSRIMVMDDDDMVRDLVIEILSPLGYDVVGAKDGDEALSLYREAMDVKMPIDLIIMDLTIPGGLSGQETVKKIHAIDPQAKVIVSSGYANDPVMAHFEEYGFCAALAKPFQIRELTEIVEKVV